MTAQREHCGQGCGKTTAYALKWCSRPDDLCALKRRVHETSHSDGYSDYMNGRSEPRFQDEYYLRGWNRAAEDTGYIECGVTHDC